MQNAKEIKSHIASVSKIRQNTNAMYLLSASRIKRMLKSIDYNREYFEKVHAAMCDVLVNSEGISHPYLEERPKNHSCYIVIASDKGLGGAYNANVLAYAWRLIKAEREPYVVTIGMKATEFFLRRGKVPDVEIMGLLQRPSIAKVRSLMSDMFTLYEARRLDEIVVVYTQYKSSAVQRPQSERLLPLDKREFCRRGAEERVNDQIVFLPGPTELINLLAPQYAVGILFDVLMQSISSEHQSRMSAMQSSTRNADEMLKKLNRQYHVSRQLIITREIAEIAAARQAQEFKNRNQEGI